MRRAHLLFLLKLAGLFAAYFLTGRLGLKLDAINGFATLVWPPAGIAFVAFLLWGYRVWPAIFLGAFFVNFTVGASIPASLTIAFGNTIGPALGVYFIRQREFHFSFDRLYDALRFIGFALFASATSATVGTIALMLSGVATQETYRVMLGAWWLGDLLGILLLTPLALTWLSPSVSSSPFSFKRKVEIFSLSALIIVSNLTAFWNLFNVAIPDIAIFLMVYSYLTWSTLSFGQRGSATSLFVLSAMAISGIAYTAGLTGSNLSQSLFQLQLFMSITSGIMIILASAYIQRKTIEQKLIAINKSKDDFLATLAHELRNPLAPIMSALEVATLNGVKEENKEGFEVIKRQAKYIARLVDDMLDISRIHRNKIILRKELVDIREVVKHAIETASPIIKSKDHNLELNLPEEPLWLETDSLRIEQGIVNLLNNAAHYTPAGGNIQVFCFKESGHICIQVKDSGIGIARDALPNLFDGSSTIIHSLGEGYIGLGIGLKLIKSLVELHSGRIGVQSEGLGTGSAFSVYLPARRKRTRLANNNNNLDLPEPPLAKKKILIVDDNKDAAISLGKLLEKLNKDVKVTHDGPSALKLAQTYNPEVILLDIGMPEMDGCEVARRLRQKENKSTLIAVTGYGQEEDKNRYKEAGFDHHLTKPIGISD